jgi:hypothetical protein
MTRHALIAAFALLAGCAPAVSPLPAPAPSAVEVDREAYAVWGAAVDALAGTGSGAHLPVIVTPVAGPLRIERATIDDMEWLMNASTARSDLVDAVRKQATDSVRIDPERVARHSRANIAETADDIARVRDDMARSRRVVGAHVQLSRVVFDSSRRYALVDGAWICGMLCGHGQTFLLEKDRRGRWKVKTGLGVMMSF